MKLSTERFVVILGIGMVATSSVASADVLFRPWKSRRESVKALTLNPEFGYLTSSANYGPDGSTYLPANLDRYSRIVVAMNAAYGLTDGLSVYTTLQYVRLQVITTTGAGNADSSGAGDQIFGFNARLWESKLPGQTVPGSFEFQTQLSVPAYNNRASLSAGTPYLGNGTIDWTAGGFFTIPLQQTVAAAWTVTGGAGFTTRSDSYSSGIPWSVDLRHRQHEQGIIGSAGIQSYQSLGNDPFEGRPTPAINPAGSGGSFATSSVNPALVSFAGSFGYQFDPGVAVAMNGTRSIYGKSSLELFTVGVGFTARWDWGTKKHPLAQSPKEYGKGNRGFVDYSGFQAKVTKTSERMNLIKIDKGSIDGVETAQVFDIFVVKPNGEQGEVIARAQVSAVKSNEASLIILEHFKEVWIEEGFIVRRPL